MREDDRAFQQSDRAEHHIDIERREALGAARQTGVKQNNRVQGGTRAAASLKHVRGHNFPTAQGQAPKQRLGELTTCKPLCGPGEEWIAFANSMEHV